MSTPARKTGRSDRTIGARREGVTVLDVGGRQIIKTYEELAEILAGHMGGMGGSWIPLVDGSEPPNLITDGAGALILVWTT